MCVKWLGIDLGGSKLKVSEQLGDLPPRLVATFSDYDLSSLPAVLAELAAGTGTVTALGISCAGDLDYQNRVIKKSLRLGNEVLIAEIAGRSFGLNLPNQTFVLNDAQAAALAELHLGVGRTESSFLFVNLGSNPGGAVVLDGHLQINKNGRNFGRLGHLCIDPRGPKCRCGRQGCLDTYVSAKAIASFAANSFGEPKTLPELTVLAEAGDSSAKAIWCYAGQQLAQAVVNLANFLGVEAAVVGGGITYAGDHLFAPLRQRVNEVSRYPIKIYPAGVECRLASVFGAAILARTGYQDL